MIQNNTIDNVEIRKEYYKSGALYWETPYVNGNKYGIEKVYYSSGALHWEAPYENGRAHGIRKDYYDSGALREEVPYVNGKAHGTVKSYYKSGALKQETPYVKGNIHGIVKSYEEDKTGILCLVLYHVGVRSSTLGNPICEWKVAWNSERILRIREKPHIMMERNMEKRRNTTPSQVL